MKDKHLITAGIIGAISALAAIIAVSVLAGLGFISSAVAAPLFFVMLVATTTFGTSFRLGHILITIAALVFAWFVLDFMLAVVGSILVSTYLLIFFGLCFYLVALPLIGQLIGHFTGAYLGEAVLPGLLFAVATTSIGLYLFISVGVYVPTALGICLAIFILSSLVSIPDAFLSMYISENLHSKSKLFCNDLQSIDYSQNRITAQLLQVNPEAYINNKGMCHGYSFLSIIYHAQGKLDIYFAILQTLSSWDGREESLYTKPTHPQLQTYDNLIQLFAQFTNDLATGMSDATIESITNNAQTDRTRQYELLHSSNYPNLIFESSPFISQQHLMHQLNKAKSNGSIGVEILMQHNFFEKHTVSIFFNEQQIILYDSSHHEKYSVYESLLEATEALIQQYDIALLRGKIITAKHKNCVEDITSTTKKLAPLMTQPISGVHYKSTPLRARTDNTVHEEKFAASVAAKSSGSQLAITA